MDKIKDLRNILKIYGKKPFDKNTHEKYLKHEKIENLKGLEIEFVYEWELRIYVNF